MHPWASTAPAIVFPCDNLVLRESAKTVLPKIQRRAMKPRKWDRVRPGTQRFGRAELRLAPVKRPGSPDVIENKTTYVFVAKTLRKLSD